MIAGAAAFISDGSISERATQRSISKSGSSATYSEIELEKEFVTLGPEALLICVAEKFEIVHAGNTVERQSKKFVGESCCQSAGSCRLLRLGAGFTRAGIA